MVIKKYLKQSIFIFLLLISGLWAFASSQEKQVDIPIKLIPKFSNYLKIKNEEKLIYNKFKEKEIIGLYDINQSFKYVCVLNFYGGTFEDINQYPDLKNNFRKNHSELAVKIPEGNVSTLIYFNEQSSELIKAYSLHFPFEKVEKNITFEYLNKSYIGRPSEGCGEAKKMFVIRKNNKYGGKQSFLYHVDDY